MRNSANDGTEHRLNILFSWKEEGQGAARTVTLKELQLFAMDRERTLEASG